MDNLDEKQIEKLKKLAEFADKSEISENLPIYEELQRMNEFLERIASKKMPEMPKIEIPQTIKIEGVEMLKGEKGDSVKGDSYILTEKDKKEIASKIKVPVVEKVIEKTEVIKEQPIVTNEIKEVAKFETPEEIANKLNELEEALNIEVIKGLKKKLEDLEKKWASRPIFGGGGFSKIAMDSHFIDDETPSEVPNGVITEFTLKHVPNPTTSLRVYNDGQRMKLGATKDYTLSGTKVTYNTAPLTDVIITFDYRI